MKEDYLWDKTGSDAGIEFLENALAEFRFQERNAPAVFPEKVLKAEEKPKRRIFTFSFAFASAVSCAAFALVLLGVWFQISNGNLENVNDLSESIAPEIKIILPEESDNVFAPAESVKTPQPIEKPAFTKTQNQTPAKRPVPQKTIYIKRKNEIPKTETVKLTEEEQYAYDQLMLALSITSSKLKLVKDKVALNETPELSIRK